MALRGDLAFRGGALGVDAAFVDQEPNQAIHRGIVRAADQRGRLTFLRNEARQDEPMQMMGKGRGGDFEFFLQSAYRQPRIAGPNQRAIDLEPR